MSQLAPDVISTYESLKSGHLKSIIYAPSANFRTWTVESSSDHLDYDSLVNTLKCSNSRCVVVDFAYTKDGEAKSEILFISWCPTSEVPAKEKMAFASSKIVLRNALSGPLREITATDESEVVQETILEILGGH